MYETEVKILPNGQIFCLGLKNGKNTAIIFP